MVNPVHHGAAFGHFSNGLTLPLLFYLPGVGVVISGEPADF